MCTAFGSWQRINDKIRDPAICAAEKARCLMHLSFCIDLHREQHRSGRYFLHEHPASALSWRTDDIKSIEKHVTVQTTVGDQCQYGPVTPAEGNRHLKVPALKPTRFMSNSSHAWSTWETLRPDSPTPTLGRQPGKRRCFLPRPTCKSNLARNDAPIHS